MLCMHFLPPLLRALLVRVRGVDTKSGVELDLLRGLFLFYAVNGASFLEGEKRSVWSLIVLTRHPNF